MNNEFNTMLANRARLEADAYDKLVKSRIQIENSIGGMARDHMISEEMGTELYQSISGQFRVCEKILSKQMARSVKQIPIYQEYLQYVKGIGPTLTTKLVAYIQDIERFPKVSMLWKYFGLAPVTYCTNCKTLKRYFPSEYEKLRWIDSTYQKQVNMIYPDDENLESKKDNILRKIENSVCNCNNPAPKVMAEKRVSGIASVDYNPRCKDLMYVISDQFVKQGKLYKELYKQYKAEETALNKDVLTKMHIHNRTKRKVSKVFLSHLWEKWRELEGLPIRQPYAQEYLGHVMIPVPDPMAEEDGKI